VPASGWMANRPAFGGSVPGQASLPLAGWLAGLPVAARLLASLPLAAKLASQRQAGQPATQLAAGIWCSISSFMTLFGL